MNTAKTSGEQLQKILVKIGNVEVDFTTVPPITGGDRKKLFLQGVDLRKFAKEDGLNPEEDAKVVLYFVRKIYPQATEEEVDELPTQVQQSILVHFLKSSREAHNPFIQPPSLTSSPTSTAGASAS